MGDNTICREGKPISIKETLTPKERKEIVTEMQSYWLNMTKRQSDHNLQVGLSNYRAIEKDSFQIFLADTIMQDFEEYVIAEVERCGKKGCKPDHIENMDLEDLEKQCKALSLVEVKRMLQMYVIKKECSIKDKCIKCKHRKPKKLCVASEEPMIPKSWTYKIILDMVKKGKSYGEYKGEIL